MATDRVAFYNQRNEHLGDVWIESDTLVADDAVAGLLDSAVTLDTDRSAADRLSRLSMRAWTPYLYARDPDAKQASESHTFHLQGKHDQSTHGRGGGGGLLTPDDVTEQQAESVVRYGTDSYVKLNRAHRDGDALSAEHQQLTDDLDAVLSKSSVTEDTVVYRGINLDAPSNEMDQAHNWLYAWDDKKKQKMLDEWGGPPLADVSITDIVDDQNVLDWFTPGTGMRDAGYMSTSQSPLIAAKFSGIGTSVIMRTTIKAGTPAIAVGRFRPYFANGKINDEQELLLGRGVTHRITGVTRETFHDRINQRDTKAFVIDVEVTSG